MHGLYGFSYGESWGTAIICIVLIVFWPLTALLVWDDLIGAWIC